MIPLAFPQLVPDRLERAITESLRRHWTPPAEPPAHTLSQTASSADRCHPASFAADDFSPVPAFPYHWGPKFHFSSFRLTLESPLPAGIYLHWRDQAEATLYYEGMPYWGLDMLHTHAPLPEGATGFLIESVCLRTGIWGAATGIDPQGSKHEGLEFVRRNEDWWHLTQDLVAVRDLLYAEQARLTPHHPKPATGPCFHPAFEQMAPVNRQWLRAIDDALDHIDHGDPAGARRIFDDLFAAHPHHMAGIRAALTGHAHIDLVWLWTERIGEFKATHTFATMTRLMEQYPEFRFSYSQPASYEAVEKFSPELAGRVRALMAEGRWEATGATYVESDTQLACGEALGRAFTLGQQAFMAMNGAPSPVLWLPDVFGYTACLPQLMRQAGVKYFFTTKLTWSVLNRFPYDSFRWRAPDGSGVIAHLSTGGNGYNGRATAQEILNSAYAHRQADIHPEFLLPVGYGDGGGGVTHEILERARRYRGVPQLPGVSWSRIDEFFDRLAPVASRLPVYQGELYLEYHRGVQTTHAKLKALFRALERAVQTLEAAHALSGRGPIDLHYWRRLVFAQFHDYIPGSSIPEVYQEHEPELRELALRALGEASRALGVESSGGGPALFNPLPYTIRYLHEGRAVLLPATSLTPIDTLTDAPAEKLTREQLGLSNARVRATFTETGEIATLTIDGNSLALTAPAGRLTLYEDTPSHFDAWDIDRHNLVHPQIPDTPVTIAADDQPGETAIAFTRDLGRKSRITTRYSLRAGDSVLRVRYEVEWQEIRRLLKVHFPTGYLGLDALYGAPFGSTPRPQLPIGPIAETQWEVPASRWAAVTHSTRSDGLFLVTEAKYGFACAEGDLQLSLLRNPRPSDSDKEPDSGLHRIEIAVGRFSPGAPRADQPFALADTLFTPPVLVSGAQAETETLPVAVEAGSSLHLAWIKPLDARTFVLRVNEIYGEPGTLRFKEPARIARLATVDLLDREQASLDPAAPVPCGPFALLGLKITIA